MKKHFLAHMYSIMSFWELSLLKEKATENFILKIIILKHDIINGIILTGIKSIKSQSFKRFECF